MLASRRERDIVTSPSLADPDRLETQMGIDVSLLPSFLLWQGMWSPLWLGPRPLVFELQRSVGHQAPAGLGPGAVGQEPGHMANVGPWCPQLDLPSAPRGAAHTCHPPRGPASRCSGGTDRPHSCPCAGQRELCQLPVGPLGPCPYNLGDSCAERVGIPLVHPTLHACIRPPLAGGRKAGATSTTCAVCIGQAAGAALSLNMGLQVFYVIEGRRPGQAWPTARAWKGGLLSRQALGGSMRVK